MKPSHLFKCLLVLLSFSVRSFAQSDSLAAMKPEKIVTKHTIKIDNKSISYTATVGTLILKNEKDEPIASFGYTAYTKDGETDMGKRPITFSYNGGPGSSSIWLHMGVMGPRRVVVNDPSPNGPAPYKLEDNNYSILDVSDIVMMDPVGTGLSRAVGKAKNSDHYYFSERGVPAFFLYTMGGSKAYHDIYDVPSAIKLEEFEDIKTLLKEFVIALSKP